MQYVDRLKRSTIKLAKFTIGFIAGHLVVGPILIAIFDMAKGLFK